MVNKPEQRILDFQKMGFGLFMHWGIYAAKEIDCWEQFFQKTSSKDYEKNIESFTGEDFNAKEIVAMAKRAGMKYIVLTTRHHEGFSLYDTKGLCEFDSVHSPAKRDIVREFVDACHEQGISPFLYHTLVDWHQESYENNFNEYLVYLRKSIEILCTNYGEIGGFGLMEYGQNQMQIGRKKNYIKLFVNINRMQ
ncbi:MAG: alpha-L-fucosidase [Oscillospiraceae bacterium]